MPRTARAAPPARRRGRRAVVGLLAPERALALSSARSAASRRWRWRGRSSLSSSARLRTRRCLLDSPWRRKLLLVALPRDRPPDRRRRRLRARRLVARRHRRRDRVPGRAPRSRTSARRAAPSSSPSRSSARPRRPAASTTRATSARPASDCRLARLAQQRPLRRVGLVDGSGVPAEHAGPAARRTSRGGWSDSSVELRIDDSRPLGRAARREAPVGRARAGASRRLSPKSSSEMSTTRV